MKRNLYLYLNKHFAWLCPEALVILPLFLFSLQQEQEETMHLFAPFSMMFLSRRKMDCMRGIKYNGIGRAKRYHHIYEFKFLLQ